MQGARFATETIRNPGAYLAAVERIGVGLALEEELDPEQQLIERLSMGLRLADGVPLSADDFFFGDTARTEALARLIRDGFLRHDGNLRATSRGLRILNAVIADLLT